MTSSSSETDRTRTGRWQFSLGRLLLLFTLAAITLGLAAWAVSYAMAFFALAVSLLTLEALIRRKITLIGLAIRVALILIVLALIAPVRHPSDSTAILAFRVLDARTMEPITNAQINLHPNGNTHRSVLVTTNEQGECRIAATFSAASREVGWGRFKFDAILVDTEIEVSAPGYESTNVSWKDLSNEMIRPADSPPSPPADILLEPVAASE